MFSKKARGYDAAAVPAAKRLRHNLADAFLGGHLTGQRTQDLYNDAEAAGAANVRDLAGSKVSKNSARNIVRKLVRRSKWPKAYKASVRLLNPKTDEVHV